MKEQLFYDLSSFAGKIPNSKYENEKRKISLTALQDYIHYMKENGVKVYPT